MNIKVRKLLASQGEKMPHVFLKPAELFIAWQPTLVTTLLGSCVGLIFYLPDSQVSAICHCQLPWQGKATTKVDDFHFVDSSIKYIREYFSSHHLDMAKLEVKMFGGAEIVEASPDGLSSLASVGQQNIEAAVTTLDKYGFQVFKKAVGGRKGYKLYIRTDNGRVLLKRI